MSQQGAYPNLPPPSRQPGFGRASRSMRPAQVFYAGRGLGSWTGNMAWQQTNLNQPTEHQSTGGGPVQLGQFDSAVGETTHVQTGPGSQAVTQTGPQEHSTEHNTGNGTQQQQQQQQQQEQQHTRRRQGSSSRERSDRDSTFRSPEPSTQQNTGNGAQQQQEQQHVRHRQGGSRERSGRDSTLRSPEHSTQQNTGNGTQQQQQQQQEQQHVKRRQSSSSRERSDRDSTLRSPERRQQQSTGQHHHQGQQWSKQHDGNRGSPTSGPYQQHGNHNQGRGSNYSQDQYNQFTTDEYYHGRGYDSNYRGNGGNSRGYDGNRRGQGRDHRGNEPFSPSSSDSSSGKQYWTDDDIVFLSKTLSYLLRHGAARQGYKVLPGGFLYVEEILKRTQKLYRFTVADVQKVVSTNDKQRFAVKQDENGQWMIRANQGHTFEVKDLDLTPITSADQVEHVIHGTYKSSWEIIKTKGLSRMTRNHIHFAVGEPGKDEVISGMRTTCDVMVYIDMKKALEAGLKFFRSANNVILSPGDEDGLIYPCYFFNAVQRHPWGKLQFDESISSGSRPIKKSSPEKKVNKKNKKAKMDDSQDGKDRKKRKQESENWKDETDGGGLYQENEKKVAESAEENKTQSQKEQTNTTPAEDKPETQTSSKTEVTESKSEATTEQETSQQKVPTIEQVSVVFQGANSEATKEQETSQQKIPPIELVSVVVQGAEGLPVSESHAERLNKAERREIETLMTALECRTKLEALTKEPSVLAVTYMGDKLGRSKSKLEMVAVTGGRNDYVILLKGDREIGQCLGKFLNDKNVIKACNGIKDLAEGLLQEYDIRIDDGQHMDIKLMYDAVRGHLSNDDKRKLEEVEGIPDEWSTEIKKMKLREVKEQGETLVRHGRKILHYYKVLDKHQYSSGLKAAKKETYTFVRLSKDHWLYEKYVALKPEKKEKKSTEQSTRQQKPESSKGGKGNKKKKNKK